MTTVAEEDKSRVLWPASPSQGWASGVDRLSGHPNGRPLRNQKWCGRLGCPDTKELHGPYKGDGGGLPTDAGSYPPAMAAHMPGGGDTHGHGHSATLAASLLNQEMILRAGTSIHSPVTPAVGFKPNMPPRLQVPADYTAATGGADSSDGHRFAQVSQSFYYYLRLYFPVFFLKKCNIDRP